MSVLITGGAGYIGSATSYLFIKKKIKTVIVDKMIYKKKNILVKKSIFYKLNISNLELIKKIIIKHNIKSVVHFAAYKDVEESILKPEKYFKNIVKKVLDEYPCKIVPKYFAYSFVLEHYTHFFKEKNLHFYRG